MKYIVIDAMSNTELDQPQILINVSSLEAFIISFNKSRYNFLLIAENMQTACIHACIDGGLIDDEHHEEQYTIEDIEEDDIDSLEDVTVRITPNMYFTFIVPYGDGDVFTNSFTEQELTKMVQDANNS